MNDGRGGQLSALEKILGKVKRRALGRSALARGLWMRAHRARLTPASRQWGMERGKPLDRVYLEHFLAQRSADIRGRVLEIGDSYYTKTFGAAAEELITYDVVDGPGIDVVGDLSTGSGLDDGSFDCLMILQTLMMIHDVQSAADTIYRLVKPGGVALVTVSFLVPNCDDPCQDMWQWNISPNAARKLLADRFGEENIEVESYGNYATASCFLAGLAAEEVEVDLWTHEPGYELLIAIRATKPSALGTA